MYVFRPPIRVKRESGVNPELTRSGKQEIATALFTTEVGVEQTLSLQMGSRC